MTATGSPCSGSPGARRVVFILLLAGVALWRGWGLNHRGLIEHDEGHNLLAARTYRDAIAWVAGGGPFRGDAAPLSEIRDRLHREGGTLYPAGKPGYVVLLAVSSFVTGQGQRPALWMSWLAGMICVALVPALLREWRCEGALPMTIATVAIGASPLLGGLSREVGGVIWALAFGMIGLWFLLRAGSAEWEGRSGIIRWRFRVTAFAAGLALGFGFTCHYNLLPLLVACFAADLARDFADARKTGQAVRWKPLSFRWCWAIAGGVAIYLVFQIGSMAAERRLRGVYPDYQNYTAELIRIVRTFQVPALEGKAVGEGTRGWGLAAWRYAGGVALREGALAFLGGLLAIAVTAVLLIRGGCRPAATGGPAHDPHSSHSSHSSDPSHSSNRVLDLFSPAAFLAVPVVFWALHPWKVERSWGMIVVALALLAGCVAAQFLAAPSSAAPLRSSHDADAVRRLMSSRFPVAVLGALIAVHLLLLAGGPWKRLWTQRSPIPEAVRLTLAHVAREGGSIQANSAGKSFAPLWKWSVIEEGRRPELQPAMRRVDFSRFDQPDIVFLDPRTWRDPDFPFTKEQVASAHRVVELHSVNPDWEVFAFDLRPDSPPTNAGITN